MDRAKAIELAAVLRTLKEERVERTRDHEGYVRLDETAAALGDAQRHFEGLAFAATVEDAP